MTNSFLNVLKNPFIIAYIVLYAVSLILLHCIASFDLTEPLFLFVIAGIGFSSLAWWATKHIEPFKLPVQHPLSECGVLAMYLLVVVAFLTWGLEIIGSSVHAEPLTSVLILVAKLAVFVVFPFLFFRWLWKYRLPDFFGHSFGGRKAWWVVLLMSTVLIVFQMSLGQGLNEISRAGLAGWTLTLGIPFVYVLLLLEVGIVEEFFFRGLLQARIAALLKSEIAGVVLTAVLFGMAHAPGFYFRTGKTLELLGPSPSFVVCISYSIVITSMVGLFMGIIWARTKNLTILIVIHAAGDLVPNIAATLGAWHLR